MAVSLFLLVIGLVRVHAEPEDFPPDFEFIGYTTNIDTPKYRLKNNVQPINFIVDLDVYLSESRFNGIVEAEVQVCLISVFFWAKVVTKHILGFWKVDCRHPI